MRAVLTLILVSLACGSAPPPPGTPAGEAAVHAAQPDKNLPPLPRTSIAAELLHREDLGLDADQVKEMQEIDEQLAEANAKLLEGRHERRANPDAGTAGRGGFGMGPGSGTGMGRRGRGGGGPRRQASGQAEPSGSAIEQRLEDNDTRAYLRAEQVLTDAQREKAREYAEAYREELYDRRHKGEAP